MDGKNLEPVRILTHFESDYGAAPKVEMRHGQTTTNIVSDFAAKCFVGVRGEIVDTPFLPICRNQIDIRFQCDSLKLAQRMPGFHWMTCYGDCTKEFGYALNGSASSGNSSRKLSLERKNTNMNGIALLLAAATLGAQPELAWKQTDHSLALDLRPVGCLAIQLQDGARASPTSIRSRSTEVPP